MKHFLFITGFIASISLHAQTSLILKKQRPPQLDVSTYTQIAVGDIVGPLGTKTEQSLDLTDALSAKLFNANTIEIIDRNALDNILGAQKYKDLQVMDDQTKQLLNKKLKNALLITGRIQSRQLEQKLIYEDQNIVVNGCNRMYYYQVKGDVTIQLKVLDVKTGRMIFNDAVVKPVDKQTKATCQTPEKMDLGQITSTAIKDLSEEIAKMVVPYDVNTTLQFNEPGFLKSPFKQLKAAVSYLQMNNADAGLSILKNYTESKEIKDKDRDNAWYNYGLGLVYTGKYADAKTALEMCASLDGKYVTVATTLMKLMDDEEQASRKMEAQEAIRNKLLEQNMEATPVKNDNIKAKPAGKPTPKAKPKKAKAV